MSLYRGYEPARSCTGSATPGCKAMMAYWLGAYGHLGAVNSGIYNCREVRGGGSYSLHAEGRADDLGVRPYRAPYATAFAEKLRLYSGELGLQLGIWNRRYWSGSYPERGWMPYSGVSPHEDHIHLELSWAAARTLTVPRIQQMIAGHLPDSSSGRPVLMQGSTGDDVKELQMALRIEVDGVFGPGTEARVREFQLSRGIPADGIVGPATWAALEGEEDMGKHIEVVYNDGRTFFQAAGRLDANSLVNENNVIVTFGVQHGRLKNVQAFLVDEGRADLQVMKDRSYDVKGGDAFGLQWIDEEQRKRPWRQWEIYGDIEPLDGPKFQPIVTVEAYVL